MNPPVDFKPIDDPDAEIARLSRLLQDTRYELNATKEARRQEKLDVIELALDGEKLVSPGTGRPSTPSQLVDRDIHSRIDRPAQWVLAGRLLPGKSGWFRSDRGPRLQAQRPGRPRQDSKLEAQAKGSQRQKFF